MKVSDYTNEKEKKAGKQVFQAGITGDGQSACLIMHKTCQIVLQVYLLQKCHFLLTQ